MYGSRNANQYEGDCILEVGDVTYIGRLMPGYQRTGNDLPVEQQPVWQIERVDTLSIAIEDSQEDNLEDEETVVENNSGDPEPGDDPQEQSEQANEEDEEDEYKYMTRRMYPNGSEGYNWVMALAETYTYDYRH